MELMFLAIKSMTGWIFPGKAQPTHVTPVTGKARARLARTTLDVVEAPSSLISAAHGRRDFLVAPPKAAPAISTLAELSAQSLSSFTSDSPSSSSSSSSYSRTFFFRLFDRRALSLPPTPRTLAVLEAPSRSPRPRISSSIIDMGPNMDSGLPFPDPPPRPAEAAQTGCCAGAPPAPAAAPATCGKLLAPTASPVGSGATESSSLSSIKTLRNSPDRALSVLDSTHVHNHPECHLSDEKYTVIYIAKEMARTDCRQDSLSRCNPNRRMHHSKIENSSSRRDSTKSSIVAIPRPESTTKPQRESVRLQEEAVAGEEMGAFQYHPSTGREVGAVGSSNRHRSSWWGACRNSASNLQWNPARRSPCRVQNRTTHCKAPPSPPVVDLPTRRRRDLRKTPTRPRARVIACLPTLVTSVPGYQNLPWWFAYTIPGGSCVIPKMRTGVSATDAR